MGQTLNNTGAELIVLKCRAARVLLARSPLEDEPLRQVINDIEGLARTIASTESSAPALFAACERAAPLSPICYCDDQTICLRCELEAAIAAARPEGE